MKLWAAIAILAVGFLLASAYVYRSEQPTDRSFTMEGKKTVVCGEFKVPFDTKEDRVQARGMRKDCGIYPGWKDHPGKERPDHRPSIEL